MSLGGDEDIVANQTHDGIGERKASSCATYGFLGSQTYDVTFEMFLEQVRTFAELKISTCCIVRVGDKS